MTATKSELKAKLKQATAMMNWALKSEDARRVNALLDLARSEPSIPILHDQLDNDPWLLNCVNGTLELKKGKLREQWRKDYITKLCPTPFLPDAPCPTWLRFLEGVFQRKARLIVFIQRLLGLCLTGDVSEHILPIFWGAARTARRRCSTPF